LKRALIAVNFGSSELDLYDDLYAVASIQGLPVSTMMKQILQFHLERDPAMRSQDKYKQFFGEAHPYKSPSR
jgi:hypothetical protein